MASPPPFSAVPPDRVQLLFLGSGTSADVPTIGCDCAVCTSTDPKGQHTGASVVISYGDTRTLMDTTPELRLRAGDRRGAQDSPL